MNDLSPVGSDQFLEEREKRHYSNRVLVLTFIAGVVVILLVLAVLLYSKQLS